MEKFVSAYDFQESFTLGEAAACILGMSARIHGPKVFAPVVKRMRDDASKGLLRIEDEQISRAEIARWLLTSGQRSEYQFDSVKSDPPTEVKEAKPLGNRERDSLLIIIAALCKDLGYDCTKHAKTARMIESTAAKLGVGIGETTIEIHLKKIPDVMATRTK